MSDTVHAGPGGRWSRRRLLTTLGVAAAVPIIGACSEDDGGSGGASGDQLAPLDDGFPSEPITLWNTFEPGHTDDLLNKAFAEFAQPYSPVPVVSETRTVAGPTSWYGLLDFLAGRQGASEGYDLYAVSWAGATVRPWTVEQLADVDPNALKPVGVLQQAPFVFAVGQDSPYQSLADVQAAAAAQPGELRGVAGATGSLIHSTLAVWQAEVGLPPDAIRFIPTTGSGESLNVVRGGGAELSVTTYTAGIDEQLRVLAVTGEERFGGLPDVPTTAELGVPIPVGSQRGYGVLTSVPDAHIDWLLRLMTKVAADPGFQERQQGFDFNVRDAAWVATYRRQIVDNIIPILEEAGLTTGLRQ
jgi:tripartite-type tricarboxylate transporter receptor subunit TctC